VSNVKKILKKEEWSDIAKIRSHYRGKAHKMFLFTNRIGFGVLLNFLALASILFGDLIRGNQVIIQIRTSGYWSPLLLLKKLSKRISVIYDSRAAEAEEIKYGFKGKIPEKQYNRMISYAENCEKRMVEIADQVFCVSNVMIEYHLSLNPALDRGKFFLYPCCADADQFSFSAETRDTLRAKLGIAGKTVLVYSGGIEMSWHIPDKVFELFASLEKRHENYFFIVLTPHQVLAERYRNQYGISKDNCLITSVKNSEVVNYLCAADAAVLLREDVLMNNVASPTKFAEYVMSGLPVIISEHVGDFSEFVRTNNIGLVLSKQMLEGSFTEVFDYVSTKLPELSSRRYSIAQQGKELFSKSSKLPAVIVQYKILQGMSPDDISTK
jgi:Glycosyl transferases group 1